MLTIMWTFKTCIRLEVVEVLYNALHSLNRALWYTHVRKTNKIHTFLNNIFHLIYPRHISNKRLLNIRITVPCNVTLCSLEERYKCAGRGSFKSLLFIYRSVLHPARFSTPYFWRWDVLTRVECMYLSNTTLYDGRYISIIYYIRYNYMFRCLTMAIFRLYMKYLISSYKRLIMGCLQWGGRRWGGHEISYVSWRLGGVGTWGFCYYMYV